MSRHHTYSQNSSSLLVLSSAYWSKCYFNVYIRSTLARGHSCYCHDSYFKYDSIFMSKLLISVCMCASFVWLWTSKGESYDEPHYNFLPERKWLQVMCTYIDIFHAYRISSNTMYYSGQQLWGFQAQLHFIRGHITTNFTCCFSALSQFCLNIACSTVGEMSDPLYDAQMFGVQLPNDVDQQDCGTVSNNAQARCIYLVH